MPFIHKSLTLALSLLASGWAGLYAAPAQALPLTWTLDNAVFSDGGAAAGGFSLNQYGFPGDVTIETSTTGGFAGMFYSTSSNNMLNLAPPNTYQIIFQIGYTDALALTFLYGLDTPAANNPLLLGGLSWECQGSYTCYAGDAGANGSIRYLESGSAGVGVGIPEPAVPALLAAALLGWRAARLKTTHP